ncbi:MAG: 1-(5-phosphoribosyl)-5-[(5-phosphoribosylamino)methylideneamino]imidazole-4-carboxamide isomerase [Deltaproteobacteria bacterium]|nr:1-(5-phosphoribosyl)-5-[(5-phosphoribosylamino)methylideneamino]imidazole-4-carboxamide isomerase [Deltaproteobacteria bacterium]MBW2595507.1 1-(5-phosphoribosyl)-5-[(5-phosphoribosylamino)methylideneamino]imidazole-4-carboxamide isomerase [Deltaproteobacteria bacterium]MBW2649678.1 1-(5-phosphoribosyl)-5-[(5-phosphoribosylamino)methylideneamino]imidazole-4-carboxamide isomerase [Deltaproteobacteria bacterium]
MLVIPAIDLKDGKCVRLLRGDFNLSTVYSDHPADIAAKWQEKGAKRIHVVDLDGSRDGLPRNMDVIREIVRVVDVPLQVGGGIRDMKTVDEYISMGVSYVILGTVALKDRKFVLDACANYRGRVILGLDARDGRVAVEGWTESTGQSPAEVASGYKECGLDSIIYTDIQRDGMESGVNIESTKMLAESVDIPIIASGGVADIHDIERLLEVADSGIMGVITGKALYTGALKLEDAIARVSTP